MMMQGRSVKTGSVIDVVGGGGGGNLNLPITSTTTNNIDMTSEQFKEVLNKYSHMVTGDMMEGGLTSQTSQLNTDHILALSTKYNTNQSQGTDGGGGGHKKGGSKAKKVSHDINQMN